MGGILALDIASSCGWAHWSAQEGLSFGTIVTQREGKSRGERFRQFMADMDGLVCRLAPIQVTIEKAHIGPDRYNVPFTLFGMQACAMAACQWSPKVRIGHVPPSVWKEHFTGYGAATKDMTIWRAKQYGWNVANDDEADALGILHWSVSKHLQCELHELLDRPRIAATG